MTSEFLWGLGKAPDVLGFTARRTKWWEQYVHDLRISPAAKHELHGACQRLVALLPDPHNWAAAPRPFRGLAVGAVQSGKTAAMIGLTAMALDQGYRIVIVLGGNKDDLRRQTARRFNTQLLKRSEPIPNSGGARTMPQADAPGHLFAYSLPYSLDSHQDHSFHNGFQKALGAGHSVVIVIKKHLASLSNVRRTLEIAFQRLGVDALPLLVLDDECDDASVDRHGLPVPEAIAALLRRESGEQPRAAYVGFTATSAANLLQSQANDLFPEHFVSLLRYPAFEESALSFPEPVPDSWYTGGETFYEAFGDAPGLYDNFLVVDSISAVEAQLPTGATASLLDAARAYIVGGAYRLALSGDWSYSDPKRLPAPHTMLVQASASQAEHRRWQLEVAGLFGGTESAAGFAYHWSTIHVASDLSQHEGEWRRWYDEFSTTRARILSERPRLRSAHVASWGQVKAQIAAFVTKVQIKVVNSDEAVGADLDFALRVSASGETLPPVDLFVVVIGGAVLSRGLTVEGLAVTYFTRWNPSPTEDTVLQLSRWYGYRGRHLEFCRLFTTAHIYAQLRHMHGNDRELREELASLMKAHRSPGDAALVFASNPRALPTGKIGDGVVHDLAFSPFATVFRKVECSDDLLQRVNQEAAVAVAAKVRGRDAEEVISPGGARKGFLSRGWAALEVAEILESFQFADHNPSNAANPARDFYRRPDKNRPIVGSRTIDDDPYQVAAYLRQWDAEGGAPTFSVGIAFGELVSDTAPFDFPLSNREITERNELSGGWSGRRVGWRGDQLFDDVEGSSLIDGTARRRTGATGLLLLYIVHKDARGRFTKGRARTYHTPAIGIVIPEGGPVWRRVTVDRRMMVAE